MDINSINVVAAPKTGTFQMRINPDVKQRVEQVFARQGLTFTDAVNIFIQQSLNENGLPFLASPENREFMKAKAAKQFLSEVQKGWDSVESEEDWISQEEAFRRLGLAE